MAFRPTVTRRYDPVTMTAQRRAFALWLGLGGGALLVLTHVLIRTWPFPDTSDTGVAVYATDHAGLPVAVRLTLLLIGTAVIAAAAAYVALASIGRSADERFRFAVLLGVVTPLVALANIYLTYHPGPEWLYESVTTGEGGFVIHRRTRNPFFVHLLLTLPLAGLVAGIVTNSILRDGSATRLLGMAAAWTIAGIVAAYVAIPVVYLLGGALTDLSEGLGIGAYPGSIVGMFLAGYVIGYVFGIVSGFSVPGTPRPDSSRASFPGSSL